MGIYDITDITQKLGLVILIGIRDYTARDIEDYHHPWTGSPFSKPLYIYVYIYIYMGNVSSSHCLMNQGHP